MPISVQCLSAIKRISLICVKDNQKLQNCNFPKSKTNCISNSNFWSSSSIILYLRYSAHEMTTHIIASSHSVFCSHYKS